MRCDRVKEFHVQYNLEKAFMPALVGKSYLSTPTEDKKKLNLRRKS
jgi:hypothetical protein